MNAARTRTHGQTRARRSPIWRHRTLEGWDGLGLSPLDEVATPAPFDIDTIKDLAGRWLIEQLVDGPMLVSELRERARDVGLSWTALKRRRLELPIESEEIVASDYMWDRRWRLVKWRAPARHPLNAG